MPWYDFFAFGYIACAVLDALALRADEAEAEAKFKKQQSLTQEEYFNKGLQVGLSVREEELERFNTYSCMHPSLSLSLSQGEKDG